MSYRSLLSNCTGRTSPLGNRINNERFAAYLTSTVGSHKAIAPPAATHPHWTAILPGIHMMATIKILTAFIFLCMLLGCSDARKIQHSAIGSGTDSSSTFQLLKKSLIDSLNKFYSLDDYIERDDGSVFVIHGTIVNGKKIGLIALTDSSIYLFQTINNVLKQTDSVKFDGYAYSFEITDLNGDEKEDYIINSAPDIHGQAKPFVFLSRKDSLLYYRPDLQLFNIRYNPSNKTVESYYESCAFCVHEKAVYAWDSDTLKLLKKAELDLTNAKKARTRIYELKNGKEYKILDASNSKIFDTALFRVQWSGSFLRR